jgi:hypothetical protein
MRVLREVVSCGSKRATCNPPFPHAAPADRPLDGRKRRRRSCDGISGSQFPRPLFSLAQRVEERCAGRNRHDLAARAHSSRSRTRPLSGPRAADQSRKFGRSGSSSSHRALRVHAQRRIRRLKVSYPDPAEMGEKAGRLGSLSLASRLFFYLPSSLRRVRFCRPELQLRRKSNTMSAASAAEEPLLTLSRRLFRNSCSGSPLLPAWFTITSK